MNAGRGISRDHAARLLGVAPDADSAEIKRAFRLWAVWAHPDHGGSAERFAELRAARDRLLEPMPSSSTRAREAAEGSDRADARGVRDVGREVPLRPRKAWADVLAVPAPMTVTVLAVTAMLSVLAVLVGIAVPMPWGIAPAAIASALWCVVLSRAILHGADHGHVIVARSLAWTVITLAQLLVATAVGIPVVEVLPVLAVPFVMAIAAVNPAAGLRRAPRVNVR